MSERQKWITGLEITKKKNDVGNNAEYIGTRCLFTLTFYFTFQRILKMITHSKNSQYNVQSSVAADAREKKNIISFER